MIDTIDNDECGKPCDPSFDCEECEECAEYWSRMRREGYWDGKRWTDKGIREMMK